MSNRDRGGYALPAAIGGLVIVGALVTSGFYMAQQELRIGVASQHAGLAVNLAQTGANDVMVNYAKEMGSMSTWDTTTFTDTLNDGFWAVKVTRVASRIYWLDATGTVTRGGDRWAGASRRLGVMARFSSADIEPPAGLTTQGNLVYGGSSEVHGIDGIPDGRDGFADWTEVCDSTSLQDKPGILIDDTTNIDWNGNRDKIEGQMSGDPLFAQDTSISIEDLMSFGDLSWDELTELADKYYTGNPTDVDHVELESGACDTSVKDNWGAPADTASDCFDYFPIIHFEQALTHLSAGVGQGILLVEGDLKVNGGFQFYGPVYVTGTLTTNGSGGHFWGGVVAANANIDTNTVLGNAVITYSSCSVERALFNNSSLTQVKPLTMRSWTDLSAVGETEVAQSVFSFGG